jgi:hypothetical protein
MPAMTGTSVPSIEMHEMTPVRSMSPKCWELSFPCVGAVAFAR